MSVQQERRQDLVEKIASRSRADGSGCIIWIGSFYPKGYGRLKVDGRITHAHRLAYEVAHGPIAKGMQIDHLCRNRACVNPEHLEAVTPLVNTRRGRASSSGFLALLKSDGASEFGGLSIAEAERALKAGWKPPEWRDDRKKAGSATGRRQEQPDAADAEADSL